MQQVKKDILDGTHNSHLFGERARWQDAIMAQKSYGQSTTSKVTLIFENNNLSKKQYPKNTQ